MHHGSIVFLQMSLKILVILKPPECGSWHQQILSPLCTQYFQMRDCCHTISWMMTCIPTLVILWKVPPFARFELQKILVPLTDYSYGRIRRNRLLYCFFDLPA